MSEKKLNCTNCGASLQGTFCHGCGQKHIEGGLTWQEVWHEVVEKVFNIERGLGLTIKELTVAPGKITSDYLRGVRKRYMSPLQYFLVCTAVYFLLADYAGLLDATEWGSIPKEAGALTAEYYAFIKAITNVKLIMYAGAPIYALFYWWLFKKRGFTYLGVLVFAIYTSAHTALLQLPFLLMAKWVNGVFEWSAGFLSLYGVWANRDFFRIGWLKAFFAMFGMYIFIWIFIAGSAALYVWLIFR